MLLPCLSSRRTFEADKRVNDEELRRVRDETTYM
jgi:hypothetical protein